LFYIRFLSLHCLFSSFTGAL